MVIVFVVISAAKPMDSKYNPLPVDPKPLPVDGFGFATAQDNLLCVWKKRPDNIIIL